MEEVHKRFGGGSTSTAWRSLCAGFWVLTTLCIVLTYQFDIVSLPFPTCYWLQIEDTQGERGSDTDVPTIPTSSVRS